MKGLDIVTVFHLAHCPPLVAAVIIFVFLVGVVPETFASATLHVENNGMDSAVCGSAISPCRSISRAITNASEGDRVVVGPGRYGDLNRNGTVESGEEAAEPGFGCDCLIKVNKQLSFESSGGAGATVIDQGSANVAHGIRIQANGVVFGKEKKGFTFNNRLTVDNSTSDVTVVDNVASASDGVFVNGSGHNGLAGAILDKICKARQGYDHSCAWETFNDRWPSAERGS